MITPAVDEKRPPVPPETTPAPPSYGETWAADAASRAARPGPSAPPVHTDHTTPYASQSHSHSQPEFGRVESLEQDSRSAISLGPEEPASLKGSARAKSQSSGGGAKSALKQGTIALVMMPVVAAAALLYGLATLRGADPSTTVIIASTLFAATGLWAWTRALR